MTTRLNSLKKLKQALPPKHRTTAWLYQNMLAASSSGCSLRRPIPPAY
jgi:hypothetical protein